MVTNSQTSFDRFREWLKANLYIGVGKSLFLWFLGISFIPLLALSFVNYLVAYAGVQSVAEKSIMATSQLRIEYLESYFKEISGFVNSESKSKTTVKITSELNQIQKTNNISPGEFTDNARWQKITSEVTKELTQKINQYGYSNIILFNTKGDIIYSPKYQENIGVNILEGDKANTGLSKIFKSIIYNGGTLFSDFERFTLSKNNIAGFMATTIKNTNNEIIGVYALEITPEKINKIIQDDVELGNTGFTYIIGTDQRIRTSGKTTRSKIQFFDTVSSEKIYEWKKFINNIDDRQYLINNELEKENISIYYSINNTYVLGVYRNLGFLQKYGLKWALFEEIDQSEAYAYARQLSDIAKITFLVTIILVFFISIAVTRKFVNPIKKLSAWAKLVQQGVLSNQKVNAPKNEVGEMVDTFNDLVASLRRYAKVSESAAIGDYSKTVPIRSEQDVLGKSMNQMVESFKKVVNQANNIAQGDYSTNVVPRSKKDTLGLALFEMTNKLRQSSIENSEQDWIKTGVSQLEEKLSGLKDTKLLSQEVIIFLSEYLKSELGLIYILEDRKLNLKSSYGFKDNNNRFSSLGIGEGLVGQCVVDKKNKIVDYPDNKLPEINDGLTTTKPHHVFITPFVFEGEVNGVLLFGRLKAFDKLQVDFIKRCTERIAVAVNAAQSHTRVEKLLEQTQKQADALQVQQEELRQANEELEEQTKALKLSEENLKRQQEELRVINEELEERTNDLQIERDNINEKNEELKKAQLEIQKKAKDLELASKYKSEFLANMSHELRTPLNSILVLSQLLTDNKKKHLDGKETEYAKTINSSGKDLLELINEILDLSKVESGKMEVYWEEVYLTEITDYVRKTFEPLTNKKGLYLKMDIDNNLPDAITTDFQKTLQVLKNLISNAIKFTSTGGITLKLSRPSDSTDLSLSGLKSSNAISMSVIDTGIGISKDKLNAIFEAFQQADGTTSRKFGGTGLGLTISKSFSSLLGGEIKVDSKVNEGSVFTLIIPEQPDNNNIKTRNTNKQDEKKEKREIRKFRKNNEEQSPDKNQQADPYNQIKDDKQKIGPEDNSILIIEDDINFCKVLQDLAHEQGFKCIVALDGEKGLYYADVFKPDAIILDIGLPGIDGYEVMKRLKNNPETRHIPIHIISASDKSLEALKMGAIGYLTKPVSNDKLGGVFKKIENIISKPIRRALIVEDDDIMRKSIINLLDEGNVEITALESGEEAFEALKKEKYECMILDLGLKELSGFELLEKVRKDKKLKELPVIIYTGQDLSQEENEKLQKYADSIIIKGARSFERLLSEASLFLHQVQKEMPDEKQKMLKTFQSKKDVLTGKKILIVDDDMRNVFALSSVLENHNMKIVIAKNGLDGLKKLEENPDTNLVLMDIMMPEMDGYEAMEKIRLNKKFKDLPLIALTAKAMKEDRAKCIAAGANDYMAKPINTDKLISLLRVWLYSK